MRGSLPAAARLRVAAEGCPSSVRCADSFPRGGSLLGCGLMVIRPPRRAILSVDSPAPHKPALFQRCVSVTLFLRLRPFGADPLPRAAPVFEPVFFLRVSAIRSTLAQDRSESATVLDSEPNTHKQREASRVGASRCSLLRCHRHAFAYTRMLTASAGTSSARTV